MSSSDFIKRAKVIIEENMHDPQFGVGDLADKLAMSRSSLLRQIKRDGLISVNQLIKDVRLAQSKILLEKGVLNVSQISFEVGFSSPSYFIKCFKDEFGMSPGEYQEQPSNDGILVVEKKPRTSTSRNLIALVVAVITLVVVIGLLRRPQVSQGKLSVAVLPFINETGDSTQRYLVNGMMESILTNLQRVGDLRVISRSSVEPFRNSGQSVTAIAKSLNVDYVVEGSFQRYKGEMLLSVQLIESQYAGQVWSEQYRRDITDLFAVQAEVSEQIANAIQVVIAPEVNLAINKKPTDNPDAYDNFLQGVEWTRLESERGLDSAIVLFDKAVSMDRQFAKAYAYLAICYYYKDIFKLKKEYTDSINRYSDRAIVLDPKMPEGLIAKGLYYQHLHQYEEAVQYFENALEIVPNSATVHNYLAEIYTNYLPDMDKYLVHAITASRLDLSGNDSTALSYSHLHLANAFAQSGIIDKAQRHIHQSLAFDPENIFSQTLEVYIDLSEDYDIENARHRLELVYRKDTTRLDVLQELAKTCYSMEDYLSAAYYYDKFIRARSVYQLEIYPEEDIIISYVFQQMGKDSLSEALLDDFKRYATNDQSKYQSLHEVFIAIYEDRLDDAIAFMDRFNQSDDFMFWIPAFLEKDPMFHRLSGHDEYDRVISDMKRKFEVNKSSRVAMLKELDLW
jgi:TolB-like protein/AraC-like DNA-binding protein/Tfp pilus assembly protein PilF